MLSSKIFGNRFIPVYTGNMTLNKILSSGVAVYPCVYREHQTYALGTTNRAGLSLCIQGTYDQKLQYR